MYRSMSRQPFVEGTETYDHYDEESNPSNEKDGLFLTAIGDTAVSNQPTDKPNVTINTSLQSKLIANVSLSHYPLKVYEENGPLQPGYLFYHMLMYSNKLEIPLPDTLIVDGSMVCHLFLDKSGRIRKAKPDFDSDELKDGFIAGVVDRFVHNSVSVLHGTKKPKEHISQRSVGVIKKPTWKTHVTNHTEPITALAVQSYTAGAMQAGNSDSFILQKFIKSRGRRPAINRLVWKMGMDNVGPTGRSIVGWNVYSKDQFTTGVSEQKDDKNSQVVINKLKRRKSAAIIPDALLNKFNESDRDYLEELRTHMDLPPSERGVITLKETQNFRKFGYKNVCSLTEDGAVTEEKSEKVVATKLSSRAIEGADIIVDRVVNFIELFAQKKHGMCISVVEIVCDFIKDDNEKWWFTQVKSIRLSRSSIPQVIRWKKFKKSQEDSFDFDDDDSDKRETYSSQYRKKIQGALEKQVDAMGVTCKLCGSCFQEGANTRSIDDSTSDSLVPGEHTRGVSNHPEMKLADFYDGPAANEAVAQRSGKSLKSGNARSSKKTFLSQISEDISAGSYTGLVPCFGYRITDRMACAVASIYRDAEFPLTKYARELLIEESRYSLAGMTKPPVTVADSTMLNGKKKRLGSVEVCIHCIRIYEEHCRFKAAASNLNASLGLGAGASSSKYTEEQSEIFAAATGEKLLRSQSRTNRTQATVNDWTTLGMSRTQHESTVETTCIQHGQPAPITTGHFEVGVEQWRILVMLHGFLDVKCEKSHPLHNAYGCVSYTLGQQVQSLSFRNHSGSDDSALGVGRFASETLWVRQCRMHYLFASPKAAGDLFSHKRLEFHLFFSPKNRTSNTVFEQLQWEGTFYVDLHNLNWKSSDPHSGREKVDILVPVETQTLGTIVAKMSVAIVMSELMPTDINELHFHKEQMCFWPPPTYHGTMPLPDAWIAMMTSRDRVVAKMQDLNTQAATSEKNKLEEMILLQKYAFFIRKVFEEEPSFGDGTFDCTSIIDSVIQSLEDEMAYAADMDREKMMILRKAIDAMILDGAMPQKVTFDNFVRKVEYYISEIKAGTEFDDNNEDVDGNDDDVVWEASPEQDRPEETLATSRPTRRSIRLSQRINSSGIPVKHQHMKRAQDTILEITNTYKNERDFDALATAVPSTTRKSRRLIVAMAIFEDVSRDSDVTDIAELRQYLIEEREKLRSVVNNVRGKRMKFPKVNHSYESTLSAKFSFIRAVVCAHLLSSSPKLRELFHIYDTKGVSIISQIGYIATVEACFRDISAARVPDDFDPVIRDMVDLVRESEEFRLSGKTYSPALTWLTCTKHGPGLFYLADLCCVNCEQEVFLPLDLEADGSSQVEDLNV